MEVYSNSVDKLWHTEYQAWYKTKCGFEYSQGKNTKYIFLRQR